MTKFKLSEEQKLEIKIAEQIVTKIQLLKRIQCLKMKEKGMTNYNIAEILSMSDQTVCDWIQKYLKDGLNSLLEWNYKGKFSILTKEQLNQLEKRNEEQPFEKASEAKDYIKKTFGIDYHLHWVQKILKKNFILHSKKQN